MTSHSSRVPSCSLHALFEFNLTLKLIACPKRMARLKHGGNRYLNFPAWVCTVTENPKTPNVFLQVQNTEYLTKKSGKKRVITSKYAQQSYMLCLIMRRVTMPHCVPVFKSNNFVLQRCCATPKTVLPKLFLSPQHIKTRLFHLHLKTVGILS